MTNLLARIASVVALGAVVLGLPAFAHAAEARPGAPAPGFSAQSIAGKTVRKVIVAQGKLVSVVVS